MKTFGRTDGGVGRKASLLNRQEEEEEQEEGGVTDQVGAGRGERASPLKSRRNRRLRVLNRSTAGLLKYTGGPGLLTTPEEQD